MADIRLTTELETSGVKRALAGLGSAAEAAGARAGAQFSKSFNGQINRFLQIGAVISLANVVATMAKDARSIQLESITSGLSPERIQAVKTLTEELGKAFSDLPIERQLQYADALIASGQAAIRTAEANEKLADGFRRLGDMRNNVKGLFDTLVSGAVRAIEKTDDLLARMPRLERALMIFPAFRLSRAISKAGPTGPDAIADIARDIAANPVIDPEKPERAVRERAARAVSAPSAGISTDQMQRIGMFVGGAGAPSVAIQRDQLGVLKQILAAQQQTIAEVRKL
jgi:hypothetical protein